MLILAAFYGITKRFLFVVCLLGLTSLASAQPHPTMPVVVQADRILIGAEYVKRCIDLPTKLVVAAGQTVTAPATGTFDCVEVSGTLVIARNQDTTLRFTHFMILPGGTLDAGTAADPILRKVTFIIRDVPIDPARDPFQWGNGLLNFGKQTRVGMPKTSFLQATGSLAAGATTLTLADDPNNWAVGDELLIPDTDKPVITGDGLQLTAVPSRREAKVTIAAIAGRQVTLSKPLDFPHLAITDPQGVVVLRPRVANLTRNIIVASEHAATPLSGTRGHTVDIGHDATWDIRSNEFVQLGRTSNTPLDDFVAATTHFGTNQRGKYAEHHHHVGSAVGSVDQGNVYRGHPLTTKWALAVHATSDALVKDNVGIDFPGAIFVTEDGYEVRNVFDHNFGAYSMGIPGDALGTPDDVHIKNGCPGCSGAGFWLHGVRNSLTGNEAWNNFRGIDLFNQNATAGTYPSAPGLMPDTPFAPTDNRLMQPIVFDDNVAAANTNTGLENWATATFPNRNFIGAYNGAQIAGVLSDGIDHYHIKPILICKPETGSIGMIANQAYSRDFKVDGGGQIAGCSVGIHGGGGTSGLFVNGPASLVLQNEVNIDQVPHVMKLTNVMHVPLGAHPHQYITFGNIGRFSGTFWTQDEPLPDVGDSDWRNQIGSQWKIEGWQGTTQNYLLLHTQQLGTRDAWYSGPGPHGWNTPVKGLSMQQSWDRYGMAWGGDVLKDADKVILDGVINAYGRAGFGVSLSPPRAVVSFPTMREPAVARGESNDMQISFSALATGNMALASDRFKTQIDNGPIIDLRDYVVPTGSDRSFNASVSGLGVHTVNVWLTQKDNPTVELAGSRWSSQFCVGATCQTTVPGVKGLTIAYASNAIMSVGLAVGPQTTMHSDTVLEGRVMATLPAVGTTVPQNTVVGLVISSGPASVPTTTQVPSVVGKTGSEAETTIAAAQLVVGAVVQTSNDAPSGIVIAQSPPAGAVVNIASRVDLTVSSGPPIPVCVPPQVLQNGVCVTPIPPPVDVCPNLDGVQTTVPPGMVIVNGQCVPVPPPIQTLTLPLTVTICDSSTPPKCQVYVPKP